MMKECEKELADFKIYEGKGAVEFLKFIGKEYISFQKKKVEFTDEQLKGANLKKTIIKTCRFYHPDHAISSGFDEKKVFLRSKITQILTRFLNTMKGF